MKVPFFFCFLIHFSSCVAQPSGVKLYAYKQAVVSGIRDSNNTTNDRLKKSTKTYFNYFIYLTHLSTSKLYFSEIWMNGTVFDVKTDTVKSTPVEIVYADNPVQTEKEVLVPATSSVVLRILLLEKTLGKSTNTKSSMVKSNELVVVYQEKGKFYSKALKKIKALRPALMQ